MLVEPKCICFEMQLLFALMSAYRYEGPKYKEEIAKSEAEKLARAIKEAGSKKSSLIEDDEVVRILSTRSKLFLHVLYNHYKKISAGRSIDEVLNLSTSSLKALNENVTTLDFHIFRGVTVIIMSSLSCRNKCLNSIIKHKLHLKTLNSA